MNKTIKNRNLDCDIVSDLLSLYHDDVVKETTKEAIKQHLETCDACKKEYEALCVELPIEKGTVNTNTKEKFLHMMKKAKRNRIVTCMIAVILIFALLVGGYFLQEQFLIADLPNEHITVYRTYRYQTDEGYKLFVLFSDGYLGSCTIKGEGEQRETEDVLVINIKKPLFVPSYYYYETYKNIEGLKEIGLRDEIFVYEYGYSSGDNGELEYVEFDSVEFGGKIIWDKDENADDVIPDYVYAYEEFQNHPYKQNASEEIVSWNTNIEEGYLEADYADGRIVKWNLDGTVLYDGYGENK